MKATRKYQNRLHLYIQVASQLLKNRPLLKPKNRACKSSQPTTLGQQVKNLRLKQQRRQLS